MVVFAIQIITNEAGLKWKCLSEVLEDREIGLLKTIQRNLSDRKVDKEVPKETTKIKCRTKSGEQNSTEVSEETIKNSFSD